jgi:hydrogenase nickel incorporation protein HypA/HybF
VHELPITQSILEITQRHAQTAGAHRVSDIYLVIGELSSIIDESVQFYWPIVSEGSIAEGARLHFRRIPTEMVCRDCETRYSPAQGEDLRCPHCGGANVRVEAGTEFYVEAIEVDDGAGGEEES